MWTISVVPKFVVFSQQCYTWRYRRLYPDLKICELRCQPLSGFRILISIPRLVSVTANFAKCLEILLLFVSYQIWVILRLLGSFLNFFRLLSRYIEFFPRWFVVNYDRKFNAYFPTPQWSLNDSTTLPNGQSQVLLSKFQ